MLNKKMCKIIEYFLFLTNFYTKNCIENVWCVDQYNFFFFGWKKKLCLFTKIHKDMFMKL